MNTTRRHGMQNPGRADTRNKEYQDKFNREVLLQRLVNTDSPVIFDIGAHRGESIDYFLKLFPKARIYSFEPDPDSFRELAGTRTSENVSCFNLAVSDKEGTASFFRNTISHTNSLLKVNFDSRDSIKLSEAKEKQDTGFYGNFNEEAQVRTTTVKAFMQEQGIEHLDLLKIDVQGAEEQVLAGCADALQRIDVVLMEICFFDYYENSTSFYDVERHLLPNGHRLFSIPTISSNPMNGRTDWVDTLYCLPRVAQ